MKVNFSSKLLGAIAITILFSCETKNSESSINSSDSISNTLRLTSDSIKSSEYTISRSYLDSLPRSFKIIVFQVEVNEGEFQLNAYYSKPGSNKEYIRIPDNVLIKGADTLLPFPFSIGNNQIRRDSILRTHAYEKVSIRPIIENQILKFKLEGTGGALAPIPLGNTNPSPPDTSLE